MAKYHDIDGMGKSTLCPRVRDESAKDRHWRRKDFNVQATSIVQQFCSEHNLKISITNFGHHWKVHNKEGKVIGINNFKIKDTEGMGFALESNNVKAGINELATLFVNQTLI